MEERTTLYAETALQRLMMEKALAMAQELERAGAAAPDGKVLDILEGLAVDRGRDFTRRRWRVPCSARWRISKKNFVRPPLPMWSKAPAQRKSGAQDLDGGGRPACAAGVFRLSLLCTRGVCR